MFPSERSGVLFTANPQSPDAGEMILEASWGLGEAVVSGAVTPDIYVIDRERLALRNVIAGDRPGNRPALSDRRQPPRLLGFAAGERDRAAAEALQREREISETVVVGERLARETECPRVERRKRAAVRRGNAIAKKARRAERPHPRTAAGVDVCLLVRRKRPRSPRV